ncbi:hypothetical protein [Embleya sp. MST-111070]
MGIRRLAMSAAAVAATVPPLLVATGTPANAIDVDPPLLPVFPG